MTFVLALVPLAACAGLIALLVHGEHRTADDRFAARHRVPANGRTWHTSSTATSVRTPRDRSCYGAEVAVDHPAHAALPGREPARGVAHAGSTSTPDHHRGGGDGVDVLDRATSRGSHTRLAGKTSDGVTSVAARVI